MRQRRGTLLRAVTAGGSAPWDDDPDAAQSLVDDGLATRGGQEDELLLPPAPGTPTPTPTPTPSATPSVAPATDDLVSIKDAC